MRVGDDLDLLDAIREAGRLMAADPKRFTGNVRANITDGTIINVNVEVLVKLTGSGAMK